MNTKVADILSLIFISVTVVLALYLYPDLPDPLPTHWNSAGEVNGYMPKPWGVAALLFATAFVFVLMKFITLVSPKSVRTEAFVAAVSLYQLLLVTFMCGIAVLVFLEAKGYDTRLNQMIFAGIGLLFIFIGMSLRKVPKNVFLGIRTPWTLANDDVWDKTHRLGGKLFVLAGLLLFINAFVRLKLAWTMTAVLALLLFPVLYSYLLYRQIQRSAGGGESR